MFFMLYCTNTKILLNWRTRRFYTLIVIIIDECFKNLLSTWFNDKIWNFVFLLLYNFLLSFILKYTLYFNILLILYWIRNLRLYWRRDVKQTPIIHRLICSHNLHTKYIWGVYNICSIMLFFRELFSCPNNK